MCSHPAVLMRWVVGVANTPAVSFDYLGWFGERGGDRRPIGPGEHVIEAPGADLALCFGAGYSHYEELISYCYVWFVLVWPKTVWRA